MSDSESQKKELSGWAPNRTASRGLYTGILILFCFPFVEVSCQDVDGVLVTRSGLQMALGGQSATNLTTTRSSLTGGQGCPLMTVFGISIVAALAISNITAAGRCWAIAETVCASVALTALLFQFVPLNLFHSDPAQHPHTEVPDFEIRYTSWLHLTFLCSLASVVLAALQIRSTGRAAGEEIVKLESEPKDPPDSD
jgi:hypothetical protein